MRATHPAMAAPAQLALLMAAGALFHASWLLLFARPVVGELIMLVQGLTG